MGPYLEPGFSDEVQKIREKIEAGEKLTAKEKRLEVGKQEAAFLLSGLAGRVIGPDYLRQLTRGENPRLAPTRRVGNTYLYLVENLLMVKFTKPHTPIEEKTDPQSDADPSSRS